MHPNPDEHYTASVIPSGKGETITQLHDRVATTLAAIISDLDNEINTLEANQPPEARSSKAILICSHAAPLIAMGRALTGNMPEDPNEEDFNVFTSCLSTFVRRQQSPSDISQQDSSMQQNERLAPGTKITRPEVKVPDWRGGQGVGGGWDCVSNGDCSFLSNGAERGWSVYPPFYFLVSFLMFILSYKPLACMYKQTILTIYAGTSTAMNRLTPAQWHHRLNHLPQADNTRRCHHLQSYDMLMELLWSGQNASID